MCRRPRRCAGVDRCGGASLGLPVGPERRGSLPGLVRRFVVKTVFPWVASRANMLYLAARTHSCSSMFTRGSYCSLVGVPDRLATTETPFLPQDVDCTGWFDHGQDTMELRERTGLTVGRELVFAVKRVQVAHNGPSLLLPSQFARYAPFCAALLGGWGGDGPLVLEYVYLGTMHTP